MEFFSHQTNFPFMATRRVWYGLSAVLLIVSFGSLFLRGLNYGIDFTGGVSAEVSFPRAANVDAVRSALTAGPSWELPVVALVSWSPVAMISRFSSIGRPMRVCV